LPRLAGAAANSFCNPPRPTPGPSFNPFAFEALFREVLFRGSRWLGFLVVRFLVLISWHGLGRPSRFHCVFYARVFHTFLLQLGFLLLRAPNSFRFFCSPTLSPDFPLSEPQPLLRAILGRLNPPVGIVIFFALPADVFPFFTKVFYNFLSLFSVPFTLGSWENPCFFFLRFFVSF